jgi:hypothetical protein
MTNLAFLLNKKAWAEKILSAPSVIFENGRDSHVVAGEVLAQTEDALIDHLAITTDNVGNWATVYVD